MVDFSLTPEQEAIQRMAREFAEKEIVPAAAQYDRSGEYPREIVKKAFKAGLVYGPVPEKYGGGGIGALDQLLIAEELSAGCAGISSCIAINSLAAIPLINYGSEAQKEKYLGAACREEKLMALCVTEPGAGSDVAALTTTARRLNGEYVISGSKSFITNGGVADYYIVFATVDLSKGHRGITAFVVPREAEGVSVGKKRG
jgi:acyl-CoA dehydrogenase